MSNYGRETVTLVDVLQPLCNLTYGEAPCTAAIGRTGTRKCYNTRATCQDAANYDPGTLVLRLAYPQEGVTRHYGYVLPILVSVTTTPGMINLAGMDRSMSALGMREVVTIRVNDMLHSDHLVDKYRLERTFRPAPRQLEGLTLPQAAHHRLAPRAFRTAARAVARDAFFGRHDSALDPYKRGTLIGKWLARNPYHANYRIIVREGYLGDPIETLRQRHYIIDRVDGPADGQATIVAKDLFSRIEAKKAVAPKASKGELAANITESATSATLSPAGIGNSEYPASGHVAIGEEICAFTRTGDTLTLTRAQLGTKASSHDDDDQVQLVLSLAADQAHEHLYTLFTGYTDIDPADIPKAEWDVAAASLTELYSTHIAKPTPVSQLAGELMRQAGFTVYADVETGKIPFVALRPRASVATVTDRNWIIKKSFSKKLEIAKRVSQVWLYFAQINPLKAVDEETNYRTRVISPDADAEGPQQYGTKAIEKEFSRWIPQGGRAFASAAADRILAMFRDPPTSVSFRGHASRAGQIALADFFTLQVAEIQDDTGAELPVSHALLALERGENELGYKSMSVSVVDTSSLTRQIFIDSDVNNLNLRTLHDSLFAAPTGSEAIEFIVAPGVTVGSTSTASPAMTTGSWPAMTTRPLIKFTDPGAASKGRIQGKAGQGGNGGNPSGATNGLTGGTALQALASIDVDNLYGEIWAGAGGGAGADGSSAVVGSKTFGYGGPSGGGGAGTQGGAPGTPGAGWVGGGNWIPVAGSSGGTGTRDAGGSGATTNTTTSGAGGAPGQAGGGSSTGQTGGAAGNYIEGNALVTWINNGDRRGGVVA